MPIHEFTEVESEHLYRYKSQSLNRNQPVYDDIRNSIFLLLIY